MDIKPDRSTQGSGSHYESPRLREFGPVGVLTQSGSAAGNEVLPFSMGECSPFFGDDPSGMC